MLITQQRHWKPIQEVLNPGSEWEMATGFNKGIVLEGLVGLYRPVQLQLLQHYWSGHRIVLLWERKRVG